MALTDMTAHDMAYCLQK